MKHFIPILLCTLLAHVGSAAEPLYHVGIEVTSPLPKGNVPMDPTIDFGEVIREHGGKGVLDPNSFEVVNVVTGKPVPFARSEDFAYGDRGRLEWVITDPGHTKYEVRFRASAVRPPLQPQARTPLIGVGDLLRYNAGQPRPFALQFPARLVDLTGDGRLDLVGCWDYAYRPGWPWSGVVCYPRVGDPAQFEFGDLTRIRYVKKPESNSFQHFGNISMTADVDFADFDGDGLVDVVWRPATRDRLSFYRNTGRRDAGGMPVFAEAGSVPVRGGGPVRTADLDHDGAMDVIVGDLWLRNTKAGLPPSLAQPVKLEVPGVHCWFDVDQDGKPDAIIREASGKGVDSLWNLCERIVWRRNLGGSPTKFDAAKPLAAVNTHSKSPQFVAAINDGEERGLLVTDWPNLTVSFYQQTGAGRFRPPALAQSKSAAISLGDQAWPHLCDWNGNGVLDLLVGGGYGWPQIVVNEGTNQQPAWGVSQYILAQGKPIRITRKEVLGDTNHFHDDFGYPYPAYVDWDGDGLPDLMLPNETNRIFWYRNIGTRAAPEFGPRHQILCDGFPDSPQKRAASAKRAKESITEHASGKRYPAEKDRPFFWRTGAAFADFNGDGLIDMVTYDGADRVASLFVQYRDESGKRGLKKQGPLKMSDGKPVGAFGHPGHWTKAFRAVDWDGDGLLDLILSSAGTWQSGGPGQYAIGGLPGGSSIQLLRNVGTPTEPRFESPRPMRMYGAPIAMTHHGPHPWAGDLDGDGLPDLVACVEWSVYPFYSHNAIEISKRPGFATRTWTTAGTADGIDLVRDGPGKAADTTKRGRLRASFAQSGGIYAGGSFDGVFGHLNAFRASPDDDINERLRAARKKGLINVVQLDYQQRWGGDRQDALKKIDAWLKRTDLSLIDAVHLSEEQAYNAGDWLDPLYDAMKARDHTLPVYVWPSFPLGPLAKADGFVYDAYGLGYTESRRKLMQFLRTGKPLIMCIDASGYSDYRAAREQVMACHEFNVPVFYFVADSGSGSYNNWYGKPTVPLSACRNFMFSAMEFQRRCRGSAPITAGDMIWAEQIELAPDEKGKVRYNWSDFGQATVYGFTRLKVADGAVKVEGNEEAALDYQFWSLLPVNDASLKLTVNPDTAPGAVRVEQSRCGKRDEWRSIKPSAAGDVLLYGLGNLGQEFRIRLTLSGGAVLRAGQLSGKSEPPSNKAINLDTFYDGWRGKIQFRQNLGVGLWRTMAVVDNPQHLDAGSSLSLRGASGYAIGASVVEKFRSDHRLNNLVIRLAGTSHSALGGSFSLGVSLDGKTIIKQGTPDTERRADGLFSGVHMLDLSDVSEFAGAQEFYVHMIQRNGSGVRGNTSSSLDRLEISATHAN